MSTALAVLLALVVTLAIIRPLVWCLLQWLLQSPQRLRSHINASPAGQRIRRHIERRTDKPVSRLGDWFGRRLDPQHFTGLPLTLLIVAATGIAMMLGELVEDLIEAEEMVRADKAINAALESWRSPDIVAVFNWLTGLAASAALAALSLVASVLFWVYRNRGVILPLWVTVLGSQITTYSAKFGFARPRPEFLTDITAMTPSFPSGHATGAMAVYGFLAYAMAREPASPRQRFEIVYWAAILIGLIGFSRVFLSVHYTSDVAAGWLVGAFWLLVGVAIAEPLRQRAHTTQRFT